MNIFEAAREKSPYLHFMMTKSGKAHVYMTHPKGGLTHAACGARPPVFGFEELGLEQIMPLNPFASTEELAPRAWARLRTLIGLVNCDTCQRVTADAVNEAWKTNGLDRYLPDGEFPMHA